MTSSGLDRGILLSDLLSAVWTDSAYSPRFFLSIGVAYIERSALYHHSPDFFVESVLRTHGTSDSLQLITLASVSAPLIVRPTIGSELRTLVGVDSAGLYITPDYGRLSPRPHELYVITVISPAGVLYPKGGSRWA